MMVMMMMMMMMMMMFVVQLMMCTSRPVMSMLWTLAGNSVGRIIQC